MTAQATALLTIQADDVGMVASINAATRSAVQLGTIDAASLMVPCPHFDEIADFCAGSDGCEWGIHATLTCEWPQLRWGPVSRDLAVRSMCDVHGHFFPSVDEFARTASAAAVALELSAQIDIAARRGIRLTYLDCHMYALYARADLMAAYIFAARSAGLLALVDSAVYMRARLPPGLLQPHCVTIQRAIRYTRHDAPSAGQWSQGYSRQVREASGPRNQLLLHLGADDPVSRALIGHRTPYGSAWRARDAEYVHSQGFGSTLSRMGIERRSWSRYA